MNSLQKDEHLSHNRQKINSKRKDLNVSTKSINLSGENIEELISVTLG